MKEVSLALLLALPVACSDDGSNGGNSGCEERISFGVSCPDDLVVGEPGTLTVDDYTADDINQLSVGAAGDGLINPPAGQVPDPADGSTTIPEPPYEFMFTASSAGTSRVTVSTFDLSNPGCSVSEVCEFEILPAE